jgi:hypothetical protein
LFGLPIAVLTVRRGVFLRRYMYDFLALLSPELAAHGIDGLLGVEGVRGP